MKRTLLFTLFAIILLFALGFSSLAAIKRVSDPYALLDPSSIMELETELLAAEEECGIPIYIYINDASKGGYLYEYDIEEMYGDSDTVVLLIERMTWGEYQCELFTYGRAYGYISDSAADDILWSEAITVIKSGQLADGISRFVTLVVEKTAEGIRDGKTTALIIAIALALIAGGSAFGLVFFFYKRKLKSQQYPLSKFASLKLDYSTDNFIGSNVVRTRVSSSSSGGGRSGGGGGGSRGRR